jgi:MHS family proline/betaine transporter-like MFS transporter
MHFQTWKQRIFIAFSSAFEYYNIAIYFALQTYIAHHFFSDTSLGDHALILVWLPYVLRFMALPFGGIFIGHYAEKYGRKAALICSSWITGIATLCMACLPTFDTIGYWAPLLIFVVQIMQAFSYGGEFPTAIVFLIENSHPKEKIRTCSILVAFNILIVSLGFMVTGLCEWLLTEPQMFDFGWRIPIFVGALNILVGYIIRSKFIQSSSIQPKQSIAVNPMTILKLVCLFAPNTILFFIHTMASKLLVSKLTSDSILQTGLPIVITALSALACLAAGYVLDKVGHTSTILKRTYMAMFFLAVPIFYLQTLGNLPILILSELLILVIFGISMALTAVYMYEKVGHDQKIITMGLSISIGSIIFVGTIPLIVNFLNQFGHAYVGLILSFGSLLYFVSLAIDQYQVRKTTSVMVKA